MRTRVASLSRAKDLSISDKALGTYQRIVIHQCERIPLP
jgi:hypothetical protein